VEAIDEAHEAYIRWYSRLVSRIDSKRRQIVALAGEEGHAHVRKLYAGLVKAAEQGGLGAAFIRAIAGDELPA
jgi:hypothetical protein